MQKWRSAGIKSYSFLYQWRGAVVTAPRCADAKIRVIVRNGESSTPVVARAGSKCPRGMRGEEAIGLDVPTTIDEAFARIRASASEPPESTRVEARYDPVSGVPLQFLAESLRMLDNDEGFVISEFERLD